jgi:hypothetical protein
MTQVMHLALPILVYERKRHENVMGIVMESGPKIVAR